MLVIHLLNFRHFVLQGSLMSELTPSFLSCFPLIHSCICSPIHPTGSKSYFVLDILKVHGLEPSSTQVVNQPGVKMRLIVRWWTLTPSPAYLPKVWRSWNTLSFKNLAAMQNLKLSGGRCRHNSVQVGKIKTWWTWALEMGAYSPARSDRKKIGVGGGRERDSEQLLSGARSNMIPEPGARHLSPSMNKDHALGLQVSVTVILLCL